MRKRWLWTGLVVVALAAGGYVAWAATQDTRSTARPSNLITGPVRRIDLRSIISDTGAVTAGLSQQVRAEVAGNVAKVHLGNGQTAAAGQVILELTSEAVQKNLEQARLDLQTAQINLNEAIDPSASTVLQQEIKVQQARLTVQSRQADVDALTVTAPVNGVVTGIGVVPGDQVNSGALVMTVYDDQTMTATAQIPQAVAAAIRADQRATIAFSGLKPLLGHVVEVSAQAQSAGRESTVPVSVLLPGVAELRPGMTGLVTIQAGDAVGPIQAQGTVTARARVDVKARSGGNVKAVRVSEGSRVRTGDVLVELESDSLLRQLVQAQNDLRSAEISLDNLKNADPAGSSLQGLRIKVEQAQLNLKSRELDAANRQVKAPIAGVISELTLQPGDPVQAGGAVGRVSDHGRLEVSLGVDELDVRKIKLDQQARITLDALPRQVFQGKVTFIATEGANQDGIATFTVTVGIDAPEGIRPGMTAKVEIPIEAKDNVLAVPAQAVTTVGNRTVVRKVMPDGTIAEVPVRVGLNTGVLVEIVEGVAEGDTVVYTTVQTSNSNSNLRIGPGGGIPGVPGGFAPPPGGGTFRVQGGAGGGATRGGGGR